MHNVCKCDFSTQETKLYMVCDIRFLLSNQKLYIFPLNEMFHLKRKEEKYLKQLTLIILSMRVYFFLKLHTLVTRSNVTEDYFALKLPVQTFFFIYSFCLQNKCSVNGCHPEIIRFTVIEFNFLFILLSQIKKKLIFGKSVSTNSIH